MNGARSADALAAWTTRTGRSSWQSSAWRIPIRGGTDGSRLSERGLPTPNLFDGGYEYHSVREWASLQDMAASAATIVRLAEVWSRRTGEA